MHELEATFPDEGPDDACGDGYDDTVAPARALVVDRERRRIADLLEAEGSPVALRLAERLRGCGRWRFGLTRCDEVARTVNGMRTLVIGCHLRLCPACSAYRRARFDRALRPQLVRLTDLGHELLFATLTTRTVADSDADLGDLMRQRVDAVAGMRRGRHRWKRWTAMVAGGLTGVEVTLYARDKATDEIRLRADGSLDRRLHAHIHMVIVLQRGVDADKACEIIQNWWREEASDRGWVTSATAQKVERVTADRLADDRNPANYCVKYVGKPADLVAPLDAFTMQRACKGLRQVNTFGVLHGSALRGARAAAQTIAPQLELDLAVDMRAETRQQRDQAEAEARDSHGLAAWAERDYGATAAHAARVIARQADWRQDVRDRQLELVLAEVWDQAVVGMATPQQDERDKRTAAALERAARGVERREAWARTQLERAPKRAARDADRERKAQERVSRATEALRRREASAVTAQDRAETADAIDVELRAARTERYQRALTALEQARSDLDARTTRLVELQAEIAATLERQAAIRDGALDRLAAAEDYVERLAGRAMAPLVASAEARAAIATERARQAVERERWRVVVVDDVRPESLADVQADADHAATERYGNVWRARQRSARLAFQAHATAEAARLRHARSLARGRAAVLQREIRRRRIPHVERPSDNDDMRRQVLLDALHSAAELACAAADAIRGVPLTWAALSRAAAAGDEAAITWLAQMQAGDAEREAAARKRRSDHVSKMQGVRPGVRAHQRTSSAQQPLPGLGSVRRQR